MVSSTIPADNKKTHNTTAYNPTSSSSSAATTTTILLKPTASSADELESPLNTLNEQISILFPKCKPKQDINANPMKSSSKMSSGSSYNLAQQMTSSLSDTSSSTLTNTLEPLSMAGAGGTGKNRSPAARKITADDEEEIISNYIETNPFRIGQNGGGAVTNITTNAASTFNSATLGSSLFGGDKYYYSQHSRSHFNNNIFDKGDTYIPTNDKKPTLRTHPIHDSSIQYVWDTPHNVNAARSPAATPTSTMTTTNLQKSDISSSHNQLLKSPIEENQHHSDLKYFDFLHHDDNNKSNSRETTFSPMEKLSKYGTSNGGLTFNDDRFDDEDDDEMMNETSYKQQSKRYDEPDYATVDVKKKNDDRLKTNGLTTGGSNIMEYEGSPRRFGLQLNNDDTNMYTSANLKLNLTSPTVYSPPRPGFPQRVIMETNPPETPPPEEISIQIEDDALNDTLNDCSEIGNNPSDYSIIDNMLPNTTFDYLYEFSETRKVLEEFFKCPSNEDDKTLEKLSDFNDGASDDINDVHYDYHRNRLESENDNSYVGQKLAQLDSKDDDYDHHEAQQHNNHGQHNSHTITVNDEKVTSPTNGYHDVEDMYENHNNFDMFLDSASRSSGEILDNETKNNLTRHHSKTFRYSPDTTDYDSNCGDLDSEISLRYIGSEFGISTDLNGGGVSGNANNFSRFYACMPVLEDGLSSGHASDTENNNSTAINLQQQQQQQHQMTNCTINDNNHHVIEHKFLDVSNNSKYIMNNAPSTTTFRRLSPTVQQQQQHQLSQQHQQINKDYGSMYGGAKDLDNIGMLSEKQETESVLTNGVQQHTELSGHRDNDYDSLYTRTIYLDSIQSTPPPPAPVPHRTSSLADPTAAEVQAALKDIRTTLKRTKTLSTPYEKSISDKNESPISVSPVWIPRRHETDNDYPNNSETEAIMGKNLSADEDDPDTDLETDRLLGHQRLDDKGFYDDKQWAADRNPTKTRSSLLASTITKVSPQVQKAKPANSLNSSSFRQGISSLLGAGSTAVASSKGAMSPPTEKMLSPITVRSPTNSILNLPPVDHQSTKYSPVINQLVDVGGISSPEHSEKINKLAEVQLQKQQQQMHDDSNEHSQSPNTSESNNLKKEVEKKKKGKNKEVLIEGVLFRARYLGSTQLVCEGQPTKSTRMMQAEEAVSRIKALSPDGDPQPSTEVDLFISTEKIMVLNTDLKEIMMDHALRTISYIADIGDLVVLMARRRFVQQDTPESNGSGGMCGETTSNSQATATPTTTTPSANLPGSNNKMNRTPKMICHVFESEEAQFIAQSIGQAFQVAYMEFLKANGIEDHSFMKEMDYQEVLNSQEIFGDELEIFAKKELQKEVVVPKAKGEILGIVIVESGWGSMLPTVVIAATMSAGAAARCGQLNIGDQIIAINGLSLVGLPLSTCQTYIKNTKTQTVVKFTVVPCAPVVEVKIKRPNTKYQLGFSVQNGVICSLLRGGIAERGGVRVGHRIIEINNQSVVAVPHEKIVNLLATSVGEILMKTMPTSMFRLLTGQENPIYI